MAGHVIGEAVRRAKVTQGEVEDVVMGCAMQQGTTVMNVARKGAIRAGLPVTVAGTTIDRQCASGLQAIAVAARSVIFDGVKVAVAGGIESISLVQNEHMNKFHAVDEELMAMKPEIYMSMLETAEVVAERYKISRERQDEYSLECQRRTASALSGPPFQRRDRSHFDEDDRLRQRDQTNFPAGHYPFTGRRSAPRHHGRGPGQDQAGIRRQDHHRR
jgi:acetyl-CoA C-acetyltransferase/acetyl-CoA acyltransferase